MAEQAYRLIHESRYDEALTVLPEFHRLHPSSLTVLEPLLNPADLEKPASDRNGSYYLPFEQYLPLTIAGELRKFSYEDIEGDAYVSYRFSSTGATNGGGRSRS